MKLFAGYLDDEPGASGELFLSGRTAELIPWACKESVGSEVLVPR
jgi:hypothetical protein